MRTDLFIDDSWLPPSRASASPRSTGDEQAVAEVRARRATSTGRARRRRRMRGPGGVTPAERGRLLHRLAEAIGARRDEIARLETSTSASRSGFAGRRRRRDATLIYNAAPRQDPGRDDPARPGVVDFTMLEPLGVPPHRAVELSAGHAIRSWRGVRRRCTVVLKRRAIAADRAAARRDRAGGRVSPGVINVVPASARSRARWVRHELVRGITFTGSVETGRQILLGAAAASSRGARARRQEPDDRLRRCRYRARGDRRRRRSVRQLRPGLLGLVALPAPAGDPRRIHRAAAGQAARLTIGPGWRITISAIVSQEQHAR